MDKNQHLRLLPFHVICSALGIPPDRFKLRKNGSEHYGPCPVHQPKNNQTSFSYSDDGRFNCFSCNAKGRGAIDLIMAIRACGFQAAVDFLTVIEPIKAPTPATNGKTVPSANAGAADGILKPLEKDTWRKFTVPCPWLEQRIPDAAVRERYGVFCYNNPARKSAYSGRVMLPVKAIDGVLYGYLGRDITSNPGQADQPKYLFPKNLPKSQFLFGAHELSRQDTPHSGRLPLKVVYLVESPFCVMKFAMYGLPALSCYGWAVSDQQLNTLCQVARGVVYIPDTNKYEDSRPQVARIAARLWVKVPPLSASVDDPEYLSREQLLSL